jgi:hypothetical protein
LTFTPCLVRSVVGPELQSLQLGDPLVDEYLAFVGARARRNTWLAVAFDLKGVLLSRRHAARRSEDAGRVASRCFDSLASDGFNGLDERLERCDEAGLLIRAQTFERVG